MKNLDLTRMEKMEMKDIEGTAYTLIAYSKALRCKVRLVIWQRPNGKKKLFFATDPSLAGEEVPVSCTHLNYKKLVKSLIFSNFANHDNRKIIWIQDLTNIWTVSYTHLDVYKRQLLVGSVRVSKVAGYINLMRLHLLPQSSHYLYILLGHWKLFYLAALIEWQVCLLYTSGISLYRFLLRWKLPRKVIALP